MMVAKTTTTTIDLSEDDVKQILVAWAKSEHGLDVPLGGVTLDFAGGHTEYCSYDHSYSSVKPVFRKAVLTQIIGG